jgi:hypothetical protein
MALYNGIPCCAIHGLKGQLKYKKDGTAYCEGCQEKAIAVNKGSGD